MYNRKKVKIIHSCRNFYKSNENFVWCCSFFIINPSRFKIIKDFRYTDLLTCCINEASSIGSRLGFARSIFLRATIKLTLMKNQYRSRLVFHIHGQSVLFVIDILYSCETLSETLEFFGLLISCMSFNKSEFETSRGRNWAHENGRIVYVTRYHSTRRLNLRAGYNNSQLNAHLNVNL